MEYITLTRENLAKEHICCAIAGEKDPQVASKKEWLARQFDEGLVFTKGDVRGKCFIEYMPAEKAWVPVDAPGYLYINCLWVSGRLAGQGYSNTLLESCINKARADGKKGLAILSSDRKRPFLADPSYLKHKGFIPADNAPPFYTLYYLPLADDAVPPAFRPCAKAPAVTQPGFVLYYTHQCPYTAKYVPLVQEAAARHGAPFKAVLLDSAQAAQNAPSPFTTYTLFFNGAFTAGEILSVPKFEKLLDEKGFSAVY